MLPYILTEVMPKSPPFFLCLGRALSTKSELVLLLSGRYQKEQDDSQSLASIMLILYQSPSHTLEWAAMNLHCLTEMLVVSCHSLHPSPVFVRWKHNNQSYFIIIVWLWVFFWLTKDNIWTLSATNPGLPAFCELDSVCFWPDLLAIWLPKAKG